jgi:hypothetical protein
MNNIDDIILALDEIIANAEQNDDPSGYFAIFYRKVIIKIKDEIGLGHFDNGPRMEQLNLIVARYYVEAYSNFMSKKQVTLSWRKAFVPSKDSRPIVLQHLLMGINAQINLDLGVALTEILKEENLADLESDFNQIYEIFSSVVHEVQEGLSADWPALKLILKYICHIDDYWVDFRLDEARDSTWKFVNQYATVPKVSKQRAFSVRDQEVAAKTDVILKPGLLAEFIFSLVRIAERGSVASKMKKLKILISN